MMKGIIVHIVPVTVKKIDSEKEAIAVFDVRYINIFFIMLHSPTGGLTSTALNV